MIYVDLGSYKWAFFRFNEFPEEKVLDQVFNYFLSEKQDKFEYELPFTPKTILKKDINNKIITTSFIAELLKLSKNDKNRLIIIDPEQINEIYNKLMSEKMEITKKEYQDILSRLNEVERKLENIHINYDY